MAIKAGQILHVAGATDQAPGLLVDRIQTAGVTSINVNEDTLEELGNFITIGTIRDIPDLSFEIESFDAGTELEEIIAGGDGTAAVDTEIGPFPSSLPLDILSPFKNSGLFTVVDSIVIPFLSLESVAYNFSLNDPMTQTVGMKGDSVFYIPGSPYQEDFIGNGILTVFTYANTAIPTDIDGVTHHVLGATIKDTGTGVVTRQFLTDDYTDSTTAITMLTAPSATEILTIVYGSTAVVSYLQAAHVGAATPVAARGRDITITLDKDAAGAGPIVFTGVQSATADWRVTLERDEEFGNSQIIAQDFDVPEVSGTITMKASDAPALFTKIQEVVGLGVTAIANATDKPPPITLDIEVKDPDAAANKKTLYVPDAVFQMPAVQGSVGNKLEVDFNWTSEGGLLEVWKRNRI